MTAFQKFLLKVKQYVQNTKMTTRKPRIGWMYAYSYDPKTKEKMPYYDTLPVVIIIKYWENGFYGLNLHYLPQKYRMEVMNILLPFYDADKKDISKIRLNYAFLNHISETIFKFAVKKYLFSHVMSHFIVVPRDAWLDVANLPVIYFKKFTNTRQAKYKTNNVHDEFNTVGRRNGWNRKY